MIVHQICERILVTFHSLALVSLSVYGLSHVLQESSVLNVLLFLQIAFHDRLNHQSLLLTGKHSTWGKGRTIPDEKEFYNLEDGTVVPSGCGVDSKTSTSLQYNEFIVYQTNQIKMRYLIKLKFDYKYKY